ncbi:hypothetical protein [Vibrio neptunius]|uniref:Uncharacterized protein n=1 Tax=Vibrio neptunius TaxID=170651 RepID=A0ABS3A3A5_9VIBR|nr:hypothetical protein [Vibrio neptunius]MBN3493469.1 hypothetical protein [Vibrio neptunius]MBN3515837.1 hypothetical protein [Vibrio neptunius]MBN3550138.1 hypothetical protein [Vibrio neptunius]MBN3578142.1 hypothetical protein [Vibrio neptunius]MCH9871806.1 hypothetical protein [Vibrio neptunius]
MTIESAKAVATEKFQGMTYSNSAQGKATNSRVSIDFNNNDGAKGVAETMGHEAAHVRIDQGQTRLREGALAEEYADTFGEYSADGMEFSAGTHTTVQLNQPKTENGQISSQDKIQLLKNTTEMYQDIIRDAQGDGVVNYRQLYADEARVIAGHAEDYATEYGLTVEEAKAELMHQALLQVDKGWSEQEHISENPRARAALESLAASQTDPASESLGDRTFLDVVFDTETSEYFTPNDEATFNDSTINAGEVSAIDAGLATGEQGFYTKYATEKGKKPIEVGIGDAAEQVKENGANIVDAVKEDPIGFAEQFADGVVDAVENLVENPEQLIFSDSNGTPQEQQYVAELMGDQEAAKDAAAERLIEDVSSLGGPIAKAPAKAAAKETLKLGNKIAKDVADVDFKGIAQANNTGVGDAVEQAQSWQTQFPYIGQDPMKPVTLKKDKVLVQVVFDADAGAAGSYFTTPSAVERATLPDGSIDANILNQGLQIDGSKYPNFRPKIQYFKVEKEIPHGEAAFGRTIANQHLNPDEHPPLPQVFLKEEYFNHLEPVDKLGDPSVKGYPMINTETPSYQFEWIPEE